MMTPKEKAFELVKTYLKFTDSRQYPDKNGRNAKQCALIALDEILKLSTFFNLIAETEYWNEVKKEIELL